MIEVEECTDFGRAAGEKKKKKYEEFSSKMKEKITQSIPSTCQLLLNSFNAG